jgi:hypothetical protein
MGVGIINTRHACQTSRLHKGLGETVGMLVATPCPGGQPAVTAMTDGARRLAERPAPRCASAGIETMQVGPHGRGPNMNPGGGSESAAGRRDE